MNSDLDRRVREVLHDAADALPPDTGLAARIEEATVRATIQPELGAADELRAPARWLIPLLAAAAVVAVVAGVAVAMTVGGSDRPKPPAATPTPTPPITTSAPTSTPTQTATSTPSPSSTSPSASVSPSPAAWYVDVDFASVLRDTVCGGKTATILQKVSVPVGTDVRFVVAASCGSNSDSYLAFVMPTSHGASAQTMTKAWDVSNLAAEPGAVTADFTTWSSQLTDGMNAQQTPGAAIVEQAFTVRADGVSAGKIVDRTPECGFGSISKGAAEMTGQGGVLGDVYFTMSEKQPCWLPQTPLPVTYYNAQDQVVFVVKSPSVHPGSRYYADVPGHEHDFNVTMYPGIRRHDPSYDKLLTNPGPITRLTVTWPWNVTQSFDIPPVWLDPTAGFIGGTEPGHGTPR